MINDGRTINLRSEDEEEDRPEFKIEHVQEESDFKSSDKVKIKFDKFVNLVATHAYEDLFEKYHDEDIVMSTNLLADLANSHEEPEDSKKMPMIFVFGIVLGIGITWVLLKTTT